MEPLPFMGVTAHCNMESTGALITYFSVNPAFSLTPWPREFLQWICASHLFQFQLFFAQHLLFKSMLYFQKLLTNMQDHSAAVQAHYKTCKVSFSKQKATDTCSPLQSSKPGNGILTLSLWKGFRKFPPISLSSLGVPGWLLMLILLGEFC